MPKRPFYRIPRPGPVITALLLALLPAIGSPAAESPSGGAVARRWSPKELYDQGARRGVAATTRDSCLTAASWSRTTRPPAVTAR